VATRTLCFALSSFWRVGSGKGADATADQVVLRDSLGLPILPGKTIKGLLRDAMTMATLSDAVSTERVVRWFGSPLAGHTASDGDQQEKLLEEGRFNSSEGQLWFGTAGLPSEWSNWIRAQQGNEVGQSESAELLRSLFTVVASTSIDENGIAREHTLRVAEVAVPMELQAEVRGPDDDLQWVQDLKLSLPLLRALGSRRNRGYGRVDVTLKEGK
jgi:CRISPR/Cas system CSM-associated protein Csm3 (group 7 of RAMP superfamily)